MSPLLIEQSGGVAVIALNRPEVMNALDSGLRAALAGAIRSVAATARVVVLTGRGRAFCAGQDLSAGAALADLDFRRVLAEEYEPLLHAIADAPVPVIAAVNGTAAGAGASLALACDVVIAAESAAFVQAFARIGLMPDAGATWALPRQIGLARAMGSALFADAIPARQAADWGMIWQAVPDAGFDAAWRAAAARLAAGPTLAYRAMRRAIRASVAPTLAAQLALESGLQAELAATADFREGVAAFAAKRPPVFRGA